MGKRDEGRGTGDEGKTRGQGDGERWEMGEGASERDEGLWGDGGLGVGEGVFV